MLRRWLMVAALAFTSAAWGVDIAITNDVAVLTFNWAGAIKSLREIESGRELAEPGQFIFISTKSDLLYSCGFTQVGANRYRWQFKDGGSLTASVKSFGLGWIYEIEELSIKDVAQIYYGWVTPKPQKWRFGPLNMFSDDDSGVILRSFCPEVGMHQRDGKILYLDVSKGYGEMIGARGMLVAGPRKILQTAMKRAAEVGGVFVTSCSGPNALGNEHARGSYLFSEMSPGSSDDWIDLAERCGMDTIHFHNAGSRGHYTPTTVLYPHGYDDFKLCGELVHSAGMRASMHTLTAGINPRDPWITPICSEGLIVRCSHTLAKDLAPSDTIMYVNEKPENFHHTFHGYGSNGNTFKFGGELIQYTGIKYDEPYAFTGVTRGAWKTNRGGVIPAGSRVDYLHQRYDAFYPAPGTKLADEMGDQIAKLYRAGNIDQIYFDGSEGLASGKPSSRYDIDAVRLLFAKKLGKDVLIEGACTQAPDCWWYLSRYGAWDHALWGAKLFVDQHSRSIEAIRKGNLIEPQNGWWKPRQADSMARGHFLDEMEYFAKRNAADDSSMSLQGVDMRRQHLTPYAVMAQVTVLGWYEHFRRAGAFTDEALREFGREGVDARLRQDASGEWTYRSVETTYRRVNKVGDGSERWCVKATRKAPAAIRVEALYAVDQSDAGEHIVGADAPFKASGSEEPKVMAELKRGQSEHGETLRIIAENTGSVERGAWAACEATWKRPYLDLKKSKSFGCWVKGDGKGETLCFRMVSPQEFSLRCPFHLVKIDFTGWRYVEFLLRERDASRWEEQVWPFSKVHNMCYLGSEMGDSPAKTLGFYLGGIAPGEKVEVEIGELTGRGILKNVTTGAAVDVNGSKYPIPFDLESGEYAELDGNVWIKYSEKGVPVGRVNATSAEVREGANEFVYNGVASVGAARAEVTVFELGPRQPALKALTSLSASAKKQLNYEAELPIRYAPKAGFEGRVPVLVRPGEQAYLELRLTGPIKNPSLTIKDGSSRVWKFPVELTAEDRLFCRDGRVWYVLRGTGCDSSQIVARGAFEEPLPALKHSTGFILGSSDPDGAAADFCVIKRYSTGATHPNLKRKYTFGQGKSGVGDTDGLLNSNWESKQK